MSARHCECLTGQCEVDHVAELERTESLTAALMRCKEVRRDALQYEDTDPIAEALNAEAAWLAIERATALHIRSQVAMLQGRQSQTDEDALFRLCVLHGVPTDTPKILEFA
mgnify:CR=1 FL=1